MHKEGFDLGQLKHAHEPLVELGDDADLHDLEQLVLLHLEVALVFQEVRENAVVAHQHCKRKSKELELVAHKRNHFAAQLSIDGRHSLQLEESHVEQLHANVHERFLLVFEGRDATLLVRATLFI